ncbi:hypothetical protein AXX17_AT1G52520 [Arabidopsis thaliana]|uniref:Uncharacterized protein n=1 Tax=Arabidopsis thaliana TaxID=3702 RepID=A0A178VZR9_ARATH|nr:hypothetical protein AXX17_AT1G52540 [Arabidopsis thaliana]OAP17797.1 hypothetical protein AXX17_AT1G52520 [Arabidopsis thaliana]
MVEAGYGSAAAKLPFLEPEVKKAKSYRTLLEAVLPIFKSVGVARPTELNTVNNAPTTHLKSLDTREKVGAWIKQWCIQNASHVAFCFGFYMAIAKKGDQLP